MTLRLLLWFGASAAVALAGTVTAASYEVGLGGYTGGHFYPPLSPGVTIAYDISTAGFPEVAPTEIHLHAEANATGPAATVQGEASGSLPVNWVERIGARTSYWVSLQPQGAGLVLAVTQVPVTIFAHVEATASGAGGALATVTTPVGGLAACAAPAGLEDICPDISHTNAISGMARVGDNYMEVYAAGFLWAEAHFSASADPLMVIDDALIPGTNINYRDAFTLEASPGIVQTAPVPEPAGMALAAAGIALLVLCGSRR